MNPILDFFQKLFDVSDWPPRWICGEWSSFHGWLYIGSDIAIWLAYFIIPVIIIYFIQSKPNIPFSPVFWLFGAFILLCGITHLLDAIIFWWPGYRISALFRFLTAVVSFATVFALIRDLPKFLSVVISDQTDFDREYFQDQLTERNNQIEQLKKEISQLKS